MLNPNPLLLLNYSRTQVCNILYQLNHPGIPETHLCESSHDSLPLKSSEYVRSNSAGETTRAQGIHNATFPDCESDNPLSATVCKVAGFSLHAGVITKANERAKLEPLCLYITRPAISAKRLSLTRNGQVRYESKTPNCQDTAIQARKKNVALTPASSRQSSKWKNCALRHWFEHPIQINWGLSPHPIYAISLQHQ